MPLTPPKVTLTVAVLAVLYLNKITSFPHLYCYTVICISLSLALLLVGVCTSSFFSRTNIVNQTPAISKILFEFIILENSTLPYIC